MGCSRHQKKFLSQTQLATMSRNGYQGPKLPKSLLDQVQNGTDSRFKARNVSRKDRRKAERQQKKTQQRRPAITRQDRLQAQESDSEDEYDSNDEKTTSLPAPAPSKVPSKDSEPLKSILKKPTTKATLTESESETEEGEDYVQAPVVSRAVKDRLQQDDDEIAALEKRLGIKGKQSKAAEQDGLDWLADGSESENEEDGRNLKRKRPDRCQVAKRQEVESS